MPHSAQLPEFCLPIKWLMHRVAGYNRRLRFSLTPKNFCCLYIFPSQPMKRKPYSYAVDEPGRAKALFGGDETDAFVDSSQCLLRQFVCLGGSLGEQAVELGWVAQELFGAVANRFDVSHHHVGKLGL